MSPLGPWCERRALVTKPHAASRPRRREYVWITLAALLALVAWLRPAQAELRFEALAGQCQGQVVERCSGPTRGATDMIYAGVQVGF